VPQHGLDVIAGLGQPIALHIPAKEGGSHPAGIASTPPAPRSLGTASLPSTWDHGHRVQPGALSGSPTGLPELLPLVQGVQEVVSHDVLPHQVVTDGSWTRGSSPSSPQPCSEPWPTLPPYTCHPWAPRQCVSSRLPPQM